MAAVILTALAGTALAQEPVYRNGFADASNPGWTAKRTFTARTGNTLLGRFHNEPVGLSLDALPRHGNAVIAMDLHVIGRWTGEASKGAAATVFTVTLDDGTLLNSSFANDDGDASRRQSFPDEPGASTRPAALGAYRLNTLGVTDDSGGHAVIDSVYRLVFAAPHSAGTLKLTLAAANLPGTVKDASWAIDNAVIYTVADNADLDAVRAAARDAVLKTSLGIDGSFAVPSRLESTPTLPSPLPVASWSTPPVGNFGMLEAAMRPAAVNARDSILADAIDAESRAQFKYQDDRSLVMGLAREMAMFPESLGIESVMVPAAAAAAAATGGRVEQPVTRRVSALVYQSRFGQEPGGEWDKPRHGAAPRGERFAGPYGDETATLKLADIPDHDQLIIDADLYTIGNWRGDGLDPSRFTITVDGQTLLAETFANEDGRYKRTQSYPGSGGGGGGGGGGKPRLPGTGSVALDSLGFSAPDKNGVGDASYHLRFVVPHANASAALKFAATGLGKDGAGAWGLDNVTVVSGGNRSMSYSDATGVEPDDNADDGDYMNPFVRQPGKEWNVHDTETSPSGETFLGRMHNQTASLTVRNFPQHTHMVVAADVIVVGDWQGNAPDPSRFGIKLSDGTVVLATSFATDGGAVDATQDYPGGSNGRNLPGAGAAGVGTLGYKDAKTGAARDAVYRLVFTLPHTSAQETISFTVSGLRGDVSSASWGLDNVTVNTYDSANPIMFTAGGGGTALGDAGALAMGNPSGGTLGGYHQGDPLGNNPLIPHDPGEFPHLPDDPGGGGGGGNPPVAPAPGALPALLVGAAVAMRRNRH
jgi:hypothetical protein